MDNLELMVLLRDTEVLQVGVEQGNDYLCRNYQMWEEVMGWQEEQMNTGAQMEDEVEEEMHELVVGED